MPIHDWAKVDANLFHHFHQAWTMAICNALNRGVLPKGYSALVEQHAGGVIPDVLTVERRTGPRRPKQPTGGGVITAIPPSAERVIRAQEKDLASRANRIVIRHALGEVISVIEIVSPGNKNSRAALRKFVEKSVEFPEHGVHVLVIDLFPPSQRDPSGIHKALWDEIEADLPYELPAERPLTLAAYVADQPITAYIRHVVVGQPLPDMPAYLDFDSYVPVPLESTYQTTWDSCPQDMREVVEHGLPDETAA